MQAFPQILAERFVIFDSPAFRYFLKPVILVWETIGHFGTNGCPDGVQIWHGTFHLFNQSQASMKGPIQNLDFNLQFDPTYPFQIGVFFQMGPEIQSCEWLTQKKGPIPDLDSFPLEPKGPIVSQNLTRLHTRVRLQCRGRLICGLPTFCFCAGQLSLLYGQPCRTRKQARRTSFSGPPSLNNKTTLNFCLQRQKFLSPYRVGGTLRYSCL